MADLRARTDRFGNRRRFRRVESGQRLILISVASRMDGVLQDLSQSGARVSLRMTPPRRGRDVLLRWGSQEIFGQVVWSSGNEAGVAFHKPISPEELVDTVGGEVPAALPVGRRVL
ncbi:hypothetical protein NSE01_28180 [Novosphingobium sediminis]|uniref:PilZ domain-containing protein n=1 Tax=Novosphingobium sediminis TaxID=707214 RepID=A0A512AMR3_9SPHN|nr:PilZ domain-containing protein [Novosphingobium sediminis]GEO00986.1 hypothetical protein NSE01_28180 [Novosphingobium sediminis]